MMFTKEEYASKVESIARSIFDEAVNCSDCTRTREIEDHLTENLCEWVSNSIDMNVSFSLAVLSHTTNLNAFFFVCGGALSEDADSALYDLAFWAMFQDVSDVWSVHYDDWYSELSETQPS